jgi:hypothetical protein
MVAIVSVIPNWRVVAVAITTTQPHDAVSRSKKHG